MWNITNTITNSNITLITTKTSQFSSLLLRIEHQPSPKAKVSIMSSKYIYISTLMPTSNQGRTYNTHCGSYTPRYRMGPTAPMLPIQQCRHSLRLSTDARPGQMCQRRQIRPRCMAWHHQDVLQHYPCLLMVPCIVLALSHRILHRRALFITFHLL